jgi:hypothetical protein
MLTDSTRENKKDYKNISRKERKILKQMKENEK